MLIGPARRRALPVAFSRSLDALLDDTFDRFLGGTRVAPPATRAPSMDVVEGDEAYTVTLDVPGLAREQLEVSVDGPQVSVAARPGEAAAPAKGVRTLYRERGSAPYARRFTLPGEVDQERSQAKLEHGVLTLTLAKKLPAGARQISVN